MQKSWWGSLGEGLVGSGSVVWVRGGVVWGIGDINQELKVLLNVHKSI